MTLPRRVIADIAEVNPRLPIELTSDLSRHVDFVPMADLSEGGVMRSSETRPLRDVMKSFTYFQNGDVVVAKITPCMENGKAAYVDNLGSGIGFGSTEFHVLRPRRDVDGQYLFWMIWGRHFRQLAQANMTGSAGQKRVPASFFGRYEIPVPALAEQKRIAAILDAVNVLRVKRRASIDQLDSLVQATFLDIFGDPLTNPKGWPTQTVDHLVRLVRGSSPRPKGDSRFYGGPIPRLMVADITRDGFYVTPMIDSLTVEGAERSRPVTAGTVVMAVSGDVGVVATVSVDCCVHDGFVAFPDLDESVVRPVFLMLQLHLLKITHERRKAGAIFQNLTTTDVKSMEIMVPRLDLQTHFASIVETVEQQKVRLKTHLAELDALFESLQLRAFSGELCSWPASRQHASA
jgi:type I restriction enzyme S subunit